AILIVSNHQSVEFTPSQSLQAGTTYFVDLRSVTDLCADRLSGPTQINFTAAFPVAPPPDLAIAMTANPSPVTSGGTLTYTITVQNLGGSTGNDVTVTDTLDASLTNIACPSIA